MPKHDPCEKTKRKILETATRLFQEKGWQNVNIEDIVKEVGFTRGAFYHYFKSREDLIYSVLMEAYFNEEPYLRASKVEGANALEQIRLSYKFYLEIVLDTIKAGVMLVSVSDPDPFVYKSNGHFILNIIAPCIEKMLIKGNAEGSTSVLYPKHTAQTVAMVFDDWLNPTVLKMSEHEFDERLLFIEHLWATLGMPAMDDELKDMMKKVQGHHRVVVEKNN